MIRASLFPTFFIALIYALLSATPVAAQSHQTHQHTHPLIVWAELSMIAATNTAKINLVTSYIFS